MKKTLSIDLKIGEIISIDSGKIMLTLADKSGRRARLTFEADESVKIRPTRVNPALDLVRNGVNV